MKSTCTIRRGQAAYTMVELMVAVLISVILMVAMYQIFARVQKIFTEGNHRGKMYEEGRAVMDLIVRDLEQIAPSGQDKKSYNWLADHPEWGRPKPAPTLADPDPEPIDYHPFYGCNFMAWPYTSTDLKVIEQPADYRTWAIETQQGWDAAISETLVSSRVEFFAQDVQWWAVGYRLYSQNNPIKRNEKIIGALWRYESFPGTVDSLGPGVLARRNDGESFYQKLSDNVIHFRMRAVSGEDPGRVLWEKPYFDKNKIPLYVEVELGIIEERLKEEILNDAEVERYDVLIEPLIAAIPNNPDTDNLIEGRNVRVKKMLAANTDRILMLRQIVPITSAMGN
jgi:hypothetical protein